MTKSGSRRIPLTRPETDEAEVERVAAVLSSGHLTQGPVVEEFEEQVGDLVGCRHAVATTSATTALHLSLAALGIGPGDEVLVADFTFPATANVVVQQGATPVLVDIDPSTFAIDPKDLADRVNARSKAIIPVHPFGLSADLDPILRIAAQHDLAVVEDAACALGADYRGRPVGSLGVVGCFSFHPRKSITTGEGGVIVTDDDRLAERLRLLRSHGGRREERRFRFDDAGYNYRLSDILAAVGVAQLPKLRGFVERRRALADRYHKLLGGVDDVGLPGDTEWGRHIYQSYVLMLPDRVDRDDVIRRLSTVGVETTLGTYALHDEPFFARTYGYKPNDLPNAHAAYRKTLTLPLFPSMSWADQDYVVEQLLGLISRL